MLGTLETIATCVVKLLTARCNLYISWTGCLYVACPSNLHKCTSTLHRCVAPLSADQLRWPIKLLRAATAKQKDLLQIYDKVFENWYIANTIDELSFALYDTQSAWNYD